MRDNGLPEGISHLYARRAREVQASAIREICKLIAKPEVRSLAGGWPDPATFPVEEIEEISRRVLEEKPDLALQYTTSEGLPELRGFLADWVKKTDGVDCTPDELFITHGSAQGMELAAKILIEPGDVALVGLPTYFGGSGACQTFGAELVGVPLDDNGMSMELLEEKIAGVEREGKTAKLVYVIPDFHNPAGTAMPAERRKSLVEIASRHDLVIVEDNPYRDLRYSGETIPPVKAYDTEDRVIYLRSFSKIFCPGLRLAFCVAHADAIRRMVIARQFEDCCANAFGQYVLFEFCRRGLLDKQIEKNCEHYRKKRDVMLRSIQKHFPEQVRWNNPDGGFFVFVHLPDGLDGEELLHEAVERNVAFVAGAPFFVDGSGKSTLRLSFAQSEPEVMEEAVEVLGKVIKKMVG
jgi:2-aminoadipate transaminase